MSTGIALACLRPPLRHLEAQRRRRGAIGTGTALLLGLASGRTATAGLPLRAVGGSAAAGVGSALAAPLLATLGLILWDKHWRGSVFALNLFKAALATPLFALVALSSRGPGSVAAPFGSEAVAALCASSFVGIVLGDTVWLLSLKFLGTRRVLLVDSLRPFFAAAAGGMVFGEKATIVGLASMSCAVLGVLIVSLERESEDNAGSKQSDVRLLGYALAVSSVVLDVLGTVLTKRFGAGMGPWLIGGFRFGFAAAFHGVIFLGYQLRALFRVHIAGHDVEAAALSERPWYSMPVMSRRSWARVTAGVIFVTFLCPAFSNHALFAIPLSLCLTLGSLSPVYAIPLVWFLKRERVSARATAGSILAVLGVIAFCNTSAL